jgi:hypothetical protein
MHGLGELARRATASQNATVLRYPARRTLPCTGASMSVGPSTSGFGFVLCKAKCTILTVYEP